jgi:hypothetical protein
MGLCPQNSHRTACENKADITHLILALVALLRMIPFVERNYNLVELGPRGTGKSHIYQQISPYSHLISGGKATVAKMFVNMATGQRGLVCQYDVVCFDEVSGISFDQKDGVNIMKGYMASGQFSRGKENIRADGSLVMLGNLDVDVQHQQRIGHLLGPLPTEMRNDTAFMDRLHAYAPGWDFPKVKPGQHLTDHFGLATYRVSRKSKPTLRVITASFDANLLAPSLSQDRVMPHASSLANALSASDHSKSTSLLKRQTCRVLGNCSALQCPNAVCFRGLDQSLQESTPNSATTCGSRYVDSDFGNARITRSLGYWTQRGPSKHSLVSRH